MDAKKITVPICGVIQVYFTKIIVCVCNHAENYEKTLSFKTIRESIKQTNKILVRILSTT